MTLECFHRAWNPWDDLANWPNGQVLRVYKNQKEWAGPDVSRRQRRYNREVRLEARRRGLL